MSAWADAFVGVPFARRGRTPEGWDCWGLVRHVLAARAGIVLGDYEIDSYDHRAIARALAPSAIAGEWQPVQLGETRALDVVVMRSIHLSGWAAETHVGIIAGPGLVLHVERATGTVCVPLGHDSVAGRLRRAYRHRSLT